MNAKNERGALSLAWCVALASLATAISLATALWMGHPREFMSAACLRLMPSPAEPQVQKKAQQAPSSSDVKLQPKVASAAAESAKTQFPAVHKCTVDGVTLYSNVECSRNPDKRQVDLQDSEGIGPPKTQAAGSAKKK